jgi:PAS domain S-box-containing protein
MQTNLAKNITSPKLLLVLTIISITAIAATIYFEYQARQDDYMHLLERQAGLFINTVRYATENVPVDSSSMEDEMDFAFRWIGQFFKRFQADENIEYVVIQNDYTIIAGSFRNYDKTDLPPDYVVRGVIDSQQSRQRILVFDNKPVYEALAPFSFNEIPFGAIRLGLSMEEYQSLQKDFGGRLFILGTVLIVFGLIFTNLLISVRHRQVLHRDLARLQDYTSTVFENLPSGVISVDEQKIVRSINKQALSFINQNYESVYEKPAADLPLDFAEAIDSHLKSQRLGPIITQKWQLYDGERRLFTLQTNLVQSNDGAQNCVLIINDITDQSQLEEQRRRNQRLDAMRNLAFSVAHEIKNPLNAINLLIDLIRKKFKPVADEEKLHKHLDTVSSEIHRISDIVEQYLRFSRPTKLDLSNVDVPTVINDIRDLIAPELASQNIQFKMDMAKHAPLQADPNLLKQLFLNLIKNAHEAIQQDGHISVTGRIVDIFYEVRVTDDGVGIPENDQSAVFDLYFTSKSKGNGVGLSVAQQIVEAHGGTINVESEEGKGTVFIVRLPTR